MSESERASFSKVVERIRAVNADMDRLLSTPGPLAESDIEALGVRLQERGECLEVLRCGTANLENSGDSAVKHQVEVFWNAFCNELKGEDEARLSHIRQRMNEVADSVRLIRKRQLLLQYR